jgi:hypothetical protein
VIVNDRRQLDPAEEMMGLDRRPCDRFGGD